MQTAIASAPTTSNLLIIDCDLAPKSDFPKNWELEKIKRKKIGTIEWDPARAKLHRSESQKGNRSTKGDYIEDEVSELELKVLNESVLRAITKDSIKIPKDFWPTSDAISQRNIFWGTTYKNGYGKRFVCCLLCYNDGITALVSYLPIDHGFGYSDPAVYWE